MRLSIDMLMDRIHSQVYRCLLTLFHNELEDSIQPHIFLKVCRSCGKYKTIGNDEPRVNVTDMVGKLISSSRRSDIGDVAHLDAEKIEREEGVLTD